jgi:hypothetical protein
VGSSFDAVLHFLSEEGIDHDLVEGEQAFTLGVNGEHGAWMCSGYVSDDEQQFVFRSHLPIEAPADRQAAIAEFITRVNYRLAAGAFAMDYEDGEIVFRTSAVSHLGPLPHSVIAPVVGLNLTLTDFFLPAITAVVAGDEPGESLDALADDELLDGGNGRPDDA